MQKKPAVFDPLLIFRYLVKWTLLVVPVAALTGAVVALFLSLLDKVTNLRWQFPWLLFLLPLCGMAIHFIYRFFGKNAEAGNNLIIDEIHEPGGGVPARMAPLVLTTTLATHLFGGSAGREGTAVQVGGSIAQWLARRFRVAADDVPVLLTTGIAAGFGAVFGTPVTGALFALEVLSVGMIRHRGLLPCLMASALADVVCRSFGIHHTAYHISPRGDGSAFSSLSVDWLLFAKVIGLGVLSGLVSRGFSLLTHYIKTESGRHIRPAWLIPVAGGACVIALVTVLGTPDYLGLGVANPRPGGVSILSCFSPGGAGPFSWGWKLLFTAVTLGTGFKGGEVTPLFFIGAALGNAVATQLGAPVDLMAGLGFIAVFAGATNTPVACMVMGIELFGGSHVLFYAVACFTAYYFSGRTGIYPAQRRVATTKA